MPNEMESGHGSMMQRLTGSPKPKQAIAVSVFFYTETSFHAYISRQLLTDSHCGEIGDYQALVIVQEEGFDEGELLLYEHLQMVPMLLQRYGQDGRAKSRRQMLAMWLR